VDGLLLAATEKRKAGGCGTDLKQALDRNRRDRLSGGLNTKLLGEVLADTAFMCVLPL
jgi:hypothetical protein